MFEQVGDFFYFWTTVYEGCAGFVCVTIIGLFLVGFFGIAFAGLVYVERSYYYLQLVVLMTILLVSFCSPRSHQQIPITYMENITTMQINHRQTR
jgi:hypothetical protein